MNVYPVFLRLEGARVVIVGGGKVAAGKLVGLREAGAVVTVVAPQIGPGFEDVEQVRRGFHPKDLDGARFVIAAATPEVNRQVALAAADRNLFVNAVDDVDSASAYLGGVLRRGEVTVAISTGGAAPALAGLIREALDAILPGDLADWVKLARRLRVEHKQARTPIERRRPLLLSKLIDLYRREPQEDAA